MDTFHLGGTRIRIDVESGRPAVLVGYPAVWTYPAALDAMGLAAALLKYAVAVQQAKVEGDGPTQTPDIPPLAIDFEQPSAHPLKRPSVPLPPYPQPPWPVGSKDNNNARRSGWFGYLGGSARDRCGYPQARQDLHAAYGEGHDAAREAFPDFPNWTNKT